ncbi:MAG: hypothetical protein K2Y29_00445 [Beijerinckiaceae bacterium]|nr:hypothetical protein [Beijerinckiaceae bacterium]
MPIRVFVGCSANGEDAESLLVLEHSIRKHASEPVEIVWMRQAHTGFWSGWDTSRWATPFSGFRWGIPSYCGFEGRAIYMDSDMIVQSDLAELWNLPLPSGRVIAAKGTWRTCVALWDCAAAEPHLPAFEGLRNHAGSHAMLVSYFRLNRHLVQAFDRSWNYCDNEDFGPLSGARIIHYTAMDTQPHLKHAIPRLAAAGQRHWFDGQVRPHPRPEIQELFDGLLAEAIVAGGRVSSYVPAVLFGPYRKQKLANYRGHR